LRFLASALVFILLNLIKFNYNGNEIKIKYLYSEAINPISAFKFFTDYKVDICYVDRNVNPQKEKTKEFISKLKELNKNKNKEKLKQIINNYCNEQEEKAIHIFLKIDNENVKIANNIFNNLIKIIQC